jgi:hypothetical protein
LGTTLVCEKCAKTFDEEQKYDHLGRNYCEDCYMDILSPPKSCDPWAVYTARTSLQGQDKLSALTLLQRRIVDVLKRKGEASAMELMEGLKLTEQELKRELVALRHMEVVKGKKEGIGVVYTLFDA